MFNIIPIVNLIGHTERGRVQLDSDIKICQRAKIVSTTPFHKINVYNKANSVIAY